MAPSRPRRWVLPAISAGGVLGAAGRYGIELAWPTPDGGFPWATFAANVSGCLLIGVLMVYVVEAGRAHPLLRPFLGVGLLGGYTTFSTYAVQVDLLTGDHPVTGLLYLFGTLAAALLAAAAGVFLSRGLVRTRHRPADPHGGSA